MSELGTGGRTLNGNITVNVTERKKERNQNKKNVHEELKEPSRLDFHDLFAVHSIFYIFLSEQ